MERKSRPSPLTHDEALELLQQIDDDAVGMSCKDADFLDSMLKQLEASPTYTPSKDQEAWILDMAGRYLDVG